MGVLTCKMANLCISPLHAGIISLSTANSSFILDRRLRSIRLCAVFLAIFLPAALVADGGFFLGPAAAVVAGPALFEFVVAATALVPVGAAGAGAASSRGFIWMIFRDRVGGGGRTNCSLGGAPADKRRRALTLSLACSG